MKSLGKRRMGVWGKEEKNLFQKVFSSFPQPPEAPAPPLRPGGLGLTRRGVELCGFVAGARVLDVGCGAGASLALLAELGCVALGLDVSGELLAEMGEQRPGLFCMRADMGRIPLRTGSVDGILCECVLSLAGDKGAVLEEMARTLRPGGRLLLTDMVLRDRDGEDGKGRCGTGGVLPCVRGAVSGARLARLLRDAGFAVLHESDETPLLRELAARIAWEFGSLAAFYELWTGTEDAGFGCDCAKDGNARPGARLGYKMIIATNKEEIR